MNQIAILFLCCCVSTLAFVFEDCGSELGKLDELTISSCDVSEEKCGFPRGTEVTSIAKFTPTKDVSKIEARAFGVILEVPVPFPLEKPLLCDDPDSGVKCPVQQGQQAVYKVTLPIEKNVPPMSLDVMWELRNENNEKILCIKFPAKIT